jgi:MFS transporter, MHS family, shikimate and dehydroshikimate transport protein
MYRIVGCIARFAVHKKVGLKYLPAGERWGGDMVTAISEGTTGDLSDGRTSPAFRRLVLASSLGSAIEHYDFFIYAFTAPIVFDAVFFPKLNPIAGLIAVYATFAIGFVARPLGGMVFGHYADRIGRKYILTLTLLTMGVASFLIGCLPSYLTIGILAPILLVSFRFLQGFAFGGEYMNAVTLNLESAPSARRGFFASWVNASGPAGIIIAAGLISILGYVYTRNEFQSWVWRIPFLLSFVLVGIGVYIRLRVDEPLLFQAVLAEKKVRKVPLLTVLRAWKKSTVLAILVNMVHSSFQYMVTIFVLGYAVKQLGVSQTGVTTGTMLANIVELLMVPLIAFYSDRFGRRPFIIAGIVLAAIWFPIYFQLIQQKDVVLFVFALVIAVGFIHALMFAPEAAFTAELFPTEVRVTGGSLGKQLGIIFGGGIAPLVATSLMRQGASFTPVIVYFEVMAVLAFIGILIAPENYKRAL